MNSYARENAERITVFEKSAGGITEVSRDFILPDSYADIKKVLAFDCRVASCDGGADKGRARYSAELECRVIFQSDEGRLKCATFREKLENTMQYVSCSDDEAIVLSPTVENLSVKAANPRKVSVRADFNSHAMIFKRKSIVPEYNGEMAGSDIPSFEEKYKQISCMETEICKTAYLEAGDDIVIDRPLPPVDSVLWAGIDVSDKRIKNENGHSVFSANASVRVVYSCTVEGEEEIRCITHVIPIEESLELGVSGTCEVSHINVYISDLACAPAEDENGEMRVLELDFKYSLCAVCAYAEEKTVISDTFSCDKITENECEDVIYPTQPKKIHAKAEVLLEMDESDDYSVLFPIVRPTSVTYVDEGISVDVAASLVCEKEGGYFVLNSENTFLIPLQGSEGMLCSVYFDNPRVDKKDGKICVQSNAFAEGISFETGKERIVSSVKAISDMDSSSRSDYTVYYPMEDEGLWDIAKRYKVRVSLIEEINSAQDGGKKGRYVIIPKREKSILSEII